MSSGEFLKFLSRRPVPSLALKWHAESDLVSFRAEAAVVRKAPGDNSAVFWECGVAMPLRFAVDETKTLEALVLVAKAWPGITQFFLAKVFFFAEKLHLNRYGRPIVGDTYVAMRNGPVPSAIYDIVKGNLDNFGNADEIARAIRIDRNGRGYAMANALREPDRRVLSDTDIECLTEAIGFCRGRGFQALSDLTHREPSWREAWERSPDSFIDCEQMIDESDQRERVLEEAREFARYGLL